MTFLTSTLARAQAKPQPTPGGFSVPFLLTNDHIVISAMIKGQGPFSFLLDSGANANIISGDVAHQLQLPLGAPTAVNGFGADQTAVPQTQPVPLSINGTSQPDQSYIILDSALHVVKTAQPVQGVLGLQLLQGQVVFIDFANGILKSISPQTPRSAWPNFAGQVALPITLGDTGIATVPVTVNGVTGNFQVDTGSNAGLILYSQFATAHADVFAQQAPSGVIEHPQLGGAVQMRTIDSAHVTLGSLSGSVPAVLITASTPPSVLGKDIAGNLGVAVLKQFEVVIDYADKLLVLTPINRRPAPSSPRS